MEMEFELGNAVEFSFELGSAAPAPAPVMPIVELTQTQYDAMETHDSGTLYAIPAEVS